MVKKITKIDNKACTEVREYLNELFQMAYEDIGLKFLFKSMTYNSDTITTKITMMLPRTGDSDLNPIELEYKKNLKTHGYLFGLSIDYYGKEFYHGNSKYEVVGCKTRRQKYPLVAKNKSNGRLVRFSQNIIS